MATPVSRVLTSSVPLSRASARAGALVMGADYRGLGAIRSLGRRGICVWVLTEQSHLVATTSRYVRRRISWPAGNPSEDAQVDFLMRLAARYELDDWVLIPTEDTTVALISRHHEVLSRRYRLTVPRWEQLRWICDKQLLYRLADRVGVARPWTAYPRTRQDLDALDCPFPVILKPAMRLEHNPFTAAKAWRADDRAALKELYDRACCFVPPHTLMVQELIPGWGEAQFSYAALCSDGWPLAAVVARRTRQYPMDFGRFSTYVETVDEPGLIPSAIRLLEGIRFTGLVEVEFKKDPRNGQYKVLDVNPRLWGWHTLSGRAGVDFPYLLWLLVRNEPVPELRGRVGERWMRMLTDVPMALQEIRHGRLSLGSYLRSLLRPTESAIFAWDDPLPGVLDAPLLAYMLAKRMLTGKGV